MARTLDVDELCCDADGRTLDRGAFVATVKERFRGAWWFNWPGRVVQKRSNGIVVVEFLGWGKRELRMKRLAGKSLKLIETVDVLTQLHRVCKRIEDLDEKTLRRVRT